MNHKKVPLIAGNWKMNKTPAEAQELILALKEKFKKLNSVKIVICPPFTSLASVQSTLNGSNISLGAQNVHWENEGAFTGEVSPRMLLTMGCQYVIIGHSERRTFFQETDEMVNMKLKAALKESLIPIVCIGETWQEREAGKTEEVIERQLKAALKMVPLEDVEKVVIAYEPVWAIGTGKNATPKQANEIHSFIREKLTGMYSKDTAQKMYIIYGGSVTPESADDLIEMPEINGFLVGGASLDPEAFEKIVRASVTPKAAVK